MALSVTTAKPQGNLKVTNHYGMQGSTYNPQQTAPVGHVQAAAPVQHYQPAATVSRVQPAATSSRIQPAVSAAEIARIAQEQRLAVEREAARQREIVRQQVQLRVDTGVANQKIKLEARAAAVPKLAVGRVPTPKIKLPEQSAYDKAYADAWHQAMTEFDQRRSTSNKSGFSAFWDKLTMGQDRRDMSARQYAEQRVREIMDRDFPDYERRINEYIARQAAAQERITKAATGKISQADYDKLVSTEQSALDTEFAQLEKQGAHYEAMTAAFGQASQKPLTSFTAKTLTKAAKLIGTENPIWRYTLGQGSANIPSLVTAPSRVANWVGNLNTKDRTIYTQGGGSFSRAGSDLNAWQATFNQRTFNARPWVDVGRGAKADAILGAEVRSLINTRKQAGEKNPDRLDYDKVMDERLRSYNRSHRGFNSAFDVAADPVNLVGGGLGLAARSASRSQFATNLLKRFTDNPLIRKLTTEVVTPGERFAATTENIRDQSRTLQTRLLQQISEKSKGANNYDISVFDDLQSMTDSELRILQRMTDGKLSIRDRLMLAGRNYAPARARLESVAAKWQDFSEQMRIVDDVKNTRFGKGKRTYSPRTVWTDDVDKYDFRLFKRRNSVQSGQDFLHGVADRFFKSNYDQHFSDLKPLWDEYSQSFTDSKAAYGAARTSYRRDATGIGRWMRNHRAVRADVSLGRAVFNTARSLPGLPTRVWKQSVLKYRPAWYVNNALYNVQAATLAGGGRALAEHARLLLPGRLNRALDEVPHELRTKLASEVGTDRIARFGTRLENWSRVAAFRGARASGYNDKQALQRVNKYLFDYSTKNWERPIKAFVPFWAFQKNLAKAAASLPFDRPAAAVGYNRLDRYQQKQFDEDFNATIPELREMGYSDAEIETFRNDQAKYFRGRLRVAGRYITTPFNAFSEKQMSQFGVTPWLSAAAESAQSVDSFGRPIRGGEATLSRRLLSKFPQVELGVQSFRSLMVNRGKLKPSERYIGEPGSEGYGLGKERQGFDASKSNYVERLDPRRRLGQNMLAFAGVPRAMTFDRDEFLKTKRLQRVTQEYFATDWRSMPFDQQQAAQSALFSRFGMTADDFFNGVLAKYDTENTKRIKDMKESARAQNQTLLDEYARQPFGTRSTWAANKLQELADSGHFGQNPFLFSFAKGANTNRSSGWLTPDSITKSRKSAEKKADYDRAQRTGDWSKWRAKYGVSKSSPYQFDGKHFKSADSMERYKRGKAKHAEAEFWRSYGAAGKDTRKKMLAENPQYNTRANWTRADWDKWRAENKVDERARILGFGNLGTIVRRNIEANQNQARRFQSSRFGGKKRVSFRLS